MLILFLLRGIGSDKNITGTQAAGAVAAMSQEAATPSPLEAVLRTVCLKAVDRTMPLIVVLCLYRSVTGLARAFLKARADAGLPRGCAPELIAMLDAVRDAACARCLEATLDSPLAVRLHRTIVSLASVAHLARPAKPRAARVKPPAQAVAVATAAPPTEKRPPLRPETKARFDALFDRRAMEPNLRAKALGSVARMPVVPLTGLAA
jgi:hypothetical protein